MLQRYDMSIYTSYIPIDEEETQIDEWVDETESPDGEWVKWADVERREKATQNLIESASRLLRMIDTRVKDDFGRPDVLDDLRYAIATLESDQDVDL